MGTSASMAGGILTISGGILTALTGTATFISVLRIRNDFPGSRIRLFSVLDPGSTSKNLSILTQKTDFEALGNMIRVVRPGSRIRILIFYPSRIPDPGVKKAPDPEHWFINIHKVAELVLCLHGSEFLGKLFLLPVYFNFGTM
jgi:hypothetical protein